jgi:hypothetical protein
MPAAGIVCGWKVGAGGEASTRVNPALADTRSATINAAGVLPAEGDPAPRRLARHGGRVDARHSRVELRFRAPYLLVLLEAGTRSDSLTVVSLPGSS